MTWFPSVPAYCCEGSTRHHNARKPRCWGRSVKIDVLQEKRSAPCLVVHRTMTMMTPKDHLQMLIFYFQERHGWLLHIPYSPPPQSQKYPANLRRNLHDERVPELLLLVLQTWKNQNLWLGNHHLAKKHNCSFPFFCTLHGVFDVSKMGSAGLDLLQTRHSCFRIASNGAISSASLFCVPAFLIKRLWNTRWFLEVPRSSMKLSSPQKIPVNFLWATSSPGSSSRLDLLRLPPLFCAVVEK